jgi:hypothetical protein
MAGGVINTAVRVPDRCEPWSVHATLFLLELYVPSVEQRSLSDTIVVTVAVVESGMLACNDQLPFSDTSP